MVVENCPYLRDPRVRREAEALTAAGYRVSVICPSHGGRRLETFGGVRVYEFPIWQFTTSVPGYITGLAQVELQGGGQSALLNGPALAGTALRERVILIWTR